MEWLVNIEASFQILTSSPPPCPLLSWLPWPKLAVRSVGHPGTSSPGRKRTGSFTLRYHVLGWLQNLHNKMLFFYVQKVFLKIWFPKDIYLNWLWWLPDLGRARGYSITTVVIVPLALWRCQSQRVGYGGCIPVPSTYIIYAHYTLNNLILNSETVLLGLSNCPLAWVLLLLRRTKGPLALCPDNLGPQHSCPGSL